MTWFWFNHFNVHAPKGEIRAFVGDYEQNAIRANALGKFGNLLAATVDPSAMLEYLDNAQNAVGHINENYAREIMSCTPWASARATASRMSRNWRAS